MDIPLILDSLVPQAEYYGVFIDNTEQEYNSLTWNDNRTKPTWAEILLESLTIAKNIKLDWLHDQHTYVLKDGFETQFGFRVDCDVKDITNWTATLKLLDLVPDKIHLSYIALKETYPELDDYDIFIIICQSFYDGQDLHLQVGESWTYQEFELFMIDNFVVTVGDYYNTQPPHMLTIKQFKLMCFEVGSYYQSLFVKKWKLRGEIIEATTISEVDAVVWE